MNIGAMNMKIRLIMVTGVMINRESTNLISGAPMTELYCFRQKTKPFSFIEKPPSIKN